jgi:hypothetical protein
VSRPTPLSRTGTSRSKSADCRALGEGRSGSRYLVTNPRRGYLFVAPVTIAEEAASEAPLAAETRRQDNLPVRLTRLIRGAVTVSSLVGQVLRLRLLPIVGLAGIGKISVALAVAEELVGTYQHGVWLIDLAALDYPRLLAATLAAVLGLDIRSEILSSSLIAALRGRQMLLLLDRRGDARKRLLKVHRLHSVRLVDARRWKRSVGAIAMSGAGTNRPHCLRPAESAYWGGAAFSGTSRSRESRRRRPRAFTGT